MTTTTDTADQLESILSHLRSFWEAVPPSMKNELLSMSPSQLARWRTGQITHYLAHLAVDEQIPSSNWILVHSKAMQCLNHYDLGGHHPPTSPSTGSPFYVAPLPDREESLPS